MKIVILAIAMLGIVPSVYSQQQDALPPNVSRVIPQDSQQKDLMSSAKDYEILTLQSKLMESQLTEIQNQLAQWQQNDNALVTKIKTENKWGDDVQWDPRHRAFLKVLPKPDVSPTSHVPAPVPSDKQLKQKVQ